MPEVTGVGDPGFEVGVHTCVVCSPSSGPSPPMMPALSENRGTGDCLHEGNHGHTVGSGGEYQAPFLKRYIRI